MGKERLIKIESDIIAIKEPIIMRLDNNGKEIGTVFDGMNKNDIYIDGDEFLVIENPSLEFINYYNRWMALISDICTGTQHYPREFNIDSDKAYEIMVVTSRYNTFHIW